jgi:hypothetical protein
VSGQRDGRKNNNTVFENGSSHNNNEGCGPERIPKKDKKYIKEEVSVSFRRVRFED